MSGAVVLCCERDRFPVALALGHHGPRHPGELVGERDLFTTGALAVIRYAKIHGAGRCRVPRKRLQRRIAITAPG